MMTSFFLEQAALFVLLTTCFIGTDAFGSLGPVLLSKRPPSVTRSPSCQIIKRPYLVVPKMSLGQQYIADKGVGKPIPKDALVTFDTSNSFAEGEVVAVKRTDGSSCFGRIESVLATSGASEYMVCVDDNNGKFLKATSETIGKFPVNSPIFDNEAGYVPPAHIAKGAHVSSMEQYRTMYRESIENPEAFWRAISDRFHWETPWKTLKKVNFDTTKGPVSIEW